MGPFPYTFLSLSVDFLNTDKNYAGNCHFSGKDNNNALKELTQATRG